MHSIFIYFPIQKIAYMHKTYSILNNKNLKQTKIQIQIHY